MSKLKNLVGLRFGRLTVLERAENSKRRETMWLCQCDCGNHSTVFGANLRKGNTKSCGCLQTESRLLNSKRHGLSRTRLHNTWTHMKQRCNGVCGQDYHLYGGRGITVCDEWQNSFEAFRDWALNNGYKEGLTLDRIDVNGNYSPQNCRWTTQKEQQRNRRNNHLITYDGRTQTMSQWSEELAISPSTICFRLSAGWTIEEALTTPVGQRRKTK